MTSINSNGSTTEQKRHCTYVASEGNPERNDRDGGTNQNEIERNKTCLLPRDPERLRDT